MTGRSVEIEKRIAAEPDGVWNALTDAEGLRRWFPLDARQDAVDALAVRVLG